MSPTSKISNHQREAITNSFTKIDKIKAWKEVAENLNAMFGAWKDVKAWQTGVEGMTAAAGVLSRPAEEFGNDSTVESMWAIKAFEHAEVYFNILCSVDPKLLRLTAHDEIIYKTFRTEFPEMKVDKLLESDLKSPEAKQMWRDFCERFKDTVEDYSFGTLLRLDHSDEYSESNSILVSRIQFYAIELARNKEGLNDCIRNKFTPRRTTKTEETK